MKAMKLHTFACLCALAPAAGAFAQHAHEGDVAVGLAGGQIAIGIHEDDGIEWGHVVFGAEFGEDPTAPNLADEPGFESEIGIFPEGALFGFDVMTSLRIWDGDFDQMAASQLKIQLPGAPVSILTPMDDVMEPGFVFAEVDDELEFHTHLEMELLDPADDGVYLLTLSLWNDQGDTASDPFWFVLNKGMDESIHDEAIDWVWDNIVPAPGTLALLLPAGLVARRRMR
jgi:hypothetical protein